MSYVSAGRRVVSLERVGECVARVLGGDERIQLAVVFGSASRGEPARDVDIGVYAKGELALGELARYAAELEECIGLPVDLVPLQYTPPLLRAAALSRGYRVIVRDPMLLIGLWIAAINEYHDIRLKSRILNGTS